MFVRRSVVTLAAAAIAVLTVTSVPAPPVHAAGKNWVVHMKGFAFVPDGAQFQGDLTIKPGDSVTWVYDEAVTDLGCETVPPCPGHSTTSVQKGWDSKVYGKESSPAHYKDNKFTVRFSKAGTFAYVCTPHASTPAFFNQGGGMKANIVVKA